MGHGSFSTIWRPSTRVFSGRVWHCQGWKKLGWPSPKPRSCRLHSLMANCVCRSCDRARPSTSTVTGMSCDVWCTQCKRWHMYKKNHGCFTTTMLWHIMHWASKHFLPKITLLCWSNLHTHQTWLRVIFSC